MFIIIILLSVLAVSCGQKQDTALNEDIAKGHSLLEQYRYSEAMEAWSEAESKALKADDQYSLGIIYQQIAHTYNATGAHYEEIIYLDKAIQAYEKAGKPYNSLHVYFESGVARYNFQDYASAEKIFINTINQSRQAADTLLEASCLEAMAALCLESPKQDPELAIRLLARKANELNYPLTCEDRGILAYAYSMTGDHRAAEEWMRKALLTAESPDEKAQIKFREYQVASRAGRTADALKALEAVVEHSSSTEASSLRHSVEDARKSYQTQQLQLAQERLHNTRIFIIFTLLATMAIVFAMIGYERYRRLAEAKALAEEKAETEKYMNIAEELKARLNAESKKQPSGKPLPMARFDLLERLCEQYYIYEGTDNLQGKILKEVKSVIEGLREDPKALKGLEAMLDSNCGNLVSRLREQMPKLKAEDIKLFIYAACGFSSTTISTILEKEKGIIYNRIWRLKGKIDASDAPDKEEFLKNITH